MEWRGKSFQRNTRPSKVRGQEPRPHWQPVAKVDVAKNRVQPANSLQVKFFVSRAMMGANWWQSPFFSPVRLPPRAAREERECICATAQLSPLSSPGGEAKCVRGPSVEGGGRSATLGTACRAPTFLNPALSTASKRNAVMAGLSCASTVSWWKNRVQPANSLQAKCFVSWLWRGRIGGSPHFSLLHDFCHGLRALTSISSRSFMGRQAGDRSLAVAAQKAL